MKRKYFLSGIIFLFLITLILSFFTFNDNLRNYLLSNVNNVYKVYSNFKTKRYLKISNFEGLSNEISSQIDMSLRLTNRKSVLHENIFYNLDLAFKKIVFEEEMLFFEKPIRKILDIDPDIYLANVWMAEIVYAKKNNLDNIKNAFKYLDKAIKISPARSEAFKTGLKIASKNKLGGKIKYLCLKYSQSEIGGALPIDHYNFFRGNNIKNMALIFPDKRLKKKIYEDGFTTKSIEVYENNYIELNKDINFEFGFIERKDFNNFSLILGTLPGLSINIDEITLIGEYESIKLDKDDFIVLSKNGFISSDEDYSIITGKGDENISFIFNENFKNIETVMIKMNFKKLKLSNFCP